MSEINYKMSGTCSRFVRLKIENNTIKSVSFDGGCPGNLTAITKLVEGMDARQAANKLAGIKCGFKNTSCPDQLAKAILTLMENNEKTVKSEK